MSAKDDIQSVLLRRESGQISSHLGLAYEGFCAARELLHLPNDGRFSLRTPEDFLIKANGIVTHFQVKFSSTGRLTIGLLRDAIEKAELTLHRDARFTVITNTAIPNTKPFLSSLAQSVADRIEVRSLSTQLQDMLAVLRSDLVEIICEQFPDVERERLEHCIVESAIKDTIALLLTYYSQLKSDEEVRRDDVFGAIKFTSLVDGVRKHLLGDAVERWHVIAGAAAVQLNHPLHEVVSAVSRDCEIAEGGIERQIRAAAREWLSTGTRSKCFLVEGELGGGKTWLLANLAETLNEDATVYWCVKQDLSGLSLQSLPKDVRTGAPVIVVVDEIGSEDIEVGVRDALLSSSAILIVASLDHIQEENVVARLRAMFPQQVELFKTTRPSSESVANLALRFRGVNASTRERRLATFSNIGFAAKVMKRDLNVAPVVSRLTTALASCQPDALAAVAVASSLLLRSPRSLLGVAASQLDSATVRMETVGTEEFAALIEPDAAAQALRLLASDKGEQYVTSRIAKIVEPIVDRADHENWRQRKFVRRLIFRLHKKWPAVAQQLFDSRRGIFQSLAERDTINAVAFYWMQPFAAYDASYAAQLARRLLNPASRTVAAVILMLQACGDEKTRSVLLAEVGGLWSEKVESWARYVERLAHLPRKQRKITTRVLVDVLRSNSIKLPELLVIRNIVHSLASNIASFGSPRDRLWFSDVLQNSIHTHSDIARRQVIPVWLKLTKRCLTQSRFRCARRLQQALFIEGYVPHSSEITSEYEELYRQEAGSFERQSACNTAREHAKALAVNSPTAANGIWEACLSFARSWLEPEPGLDLWREAFAFVRAATRDGTPFEGVDGTVHELLFAANRYSETLEPAYVGEVLRVAPGVNVGPKGPSGYVTALATFVGFLRHVSDCSVSASNTLKEALLSLGKAPNLLWQFSKTYADLVGFSAAEQLVTKTQADNVVVAALLHQVGVCPWGAADASVLRTAISSAVERFPSVWPQASYPLLSLGFAEDALNLLTKRGATDPDADMMRICCLAALGRRANAIDGFRAYLTTRPHTDEAAHPRSIALALLFLSAAAAHDEQIILLILSALTRNRLLPPLGEAIKEPSHVRVASNAT
ncbi:MAG: hypothetical protein LAO06_00885 [Acidobacteriia bacterium]|nr:hypothetical protein [Terriglobia bacterium]